MKHPVSKQAIVILHGWGASSSSFAETSHLLQKKGYAVYVPDLPGFGKNPLQKDSLFFEDYVKFARESVETMKSINGKVILIGHSFGGRIAIALVSNYPDLVAKLILTGASGIPRGLPSFRKKFVYVLTKIARPIFYVPPFSIFYRFFRKLVYYSIGELDYYKASETGLSQTFKNVYKVNIVNALSKITVPTLLVWGEEDQMTPLADGEYMHKHIKDSEFIVVPRASHRLPYEDPEKFVETILPFFK